MATVRGGDVTQLMIGGREFDVKSDANVTYRTNGFTNETAPTGNGGIHTKRTRKLGGFDALPISVDPSKGDLEYLQAAADLGDPVNIQMTLVGGETYSGDLVIQGALDANTGDGQVDITALGVVFEQL